MTSKSPSQALLVIHGIGQQQPFQALDSFANGLRSTLTRDGYTVITKHLLYGREEIFNNGIQIKAEKNEQNSESISLDIYEFYWAPLTQEKATFSQIVSWLAATGFTPIRRFAFNLPLLIQRVNTLTNNRSNNNSLNTTDRNTTSSESSGFWQKPSRKKSILICWEFLRELLRVILVAAAGVIIATGATTLVSKAASLVKSLPNTFTPIIPEIITRSGILSIAVTIVLIFAIIALTLSIPEQIRDLSRFRKVQPLIFSEAGTAASEAYKNESQWLDKFINAAKAGIRVLIKSTRALDSWYTELKARRLFIFLSIVALFFALLIFTWFVSATSICVVGICPNTIVHKILYLLLSSNFIVVVLIVGFGWLIKRIFLDYIADIALYTSADENSSFYATRQTILKEATHRIRSLLQDKRYSSVAIAGHSLGSVIAYDSINWLRTESMVQSSDGLSTTESELETILQNLPEEYMEKAIDLLQKLKESAGSNQASSTGSTMDKQGPGLDGQIKVDEFHKLEAFITFGSPLNKVLYFFRIRTKIYETIRAHIVNEIHGFRQHEDLLTRDPDIKDDTASVTDNVRWLNVYSPMDPISSRLIFYNHVDEQPLWYALWGKCHINYWHDPRFYRTVLSYLRSDK